MELPRRSQRAGSRRPAYDAAISTLKPSRRKEAAEPIVVEDKEEEAAEPVVVDDAGLEGVLLSIEGGSVRMSVEEIKEIEEAVELLVHYRSDGEGGQERYYEYHTDAEQAMVSRAMKIQHILDDRRRKARQRVDRNARRREANALNARCEAEGGEIFGTSKRGRRPAVAVDDVSDKQPPKKKKKKKKKKAAVLVSQAGSARKSQTAPPASEQRAASQRQNSVSLFLTEGTPEDDEEPPPFEYRIGLCCRRGKDSVDDTWFVTSDEDMAGSVSKWINETVVDIKGIVKAGKLTAAYQGLAAHNAAKITWKDARSWSGIVRQLELFNRASRPELRVTVDIELEPIVVVPPTLTPATQRTATTIQLVGLPQNQEAMRVDGNYSKSITSRWTCENRNCRNYGHNCYIPPDARDHPTTHYPVYKPQLMAW
ncbi:uncharacterized protein RCC_11095 [Ramularia collo-cygni]|uniref:Uncharacterized protein n=1 Tax=Ramularia collo-cygni TaxID=112498 RepID=A0A2D3VQ60_9PEZI|nr:uncharacterized protein RCC_11095 [Ramularia collo-cygni]CZT25364.1 uncharacterized protein RCC_11095 [Ramularia collo-cygni]